MLKLIVASLNQSLDLGNRSRFKQYGPISYGWPSDNLWPPEEADLTQPNRFFCPASGAVGTP